MPPGRIRLAHLLARRVTSGCAQLSRNFEAEHHHFTASILHDLRCIRSRFRVYRQSLASLFTADNHFVAQLTHLRDVEAAPAVQELHNPKVTCPS
jgi:hypothetical protein